MSEPPLLTLLQSCNNSCIMCIYPPNFPNFNIEISEIKKILANCPQNSTKFVVSGGEPTLHKDIFHILRLIKQKLPHAELHMLTNGRMFYYSEFTKKFVETGCDFVVIPVHGQNSKLHDKITRAPNSFNQTVQGVKNLLAYKNKIKIEIRVVIHKMNYKQLPKICEFISKEFKGINRVVLFPIDIIGSANINRKKLTVKMKAIKPCLERGLSILEKNGFEFQLFHIPFCIINEKYWENVAGMSVEPHRVTFEPCSGCKMKERCPGIWKTYAFRVGTKEFKHIGC